MEGDLYETLGVGKDATPGEIKRAYRRKAKQHHPDTGGATEKFHALTLAYDVLSDDIRRERYDRTGETDDRRRPDTEQAALAVIAKLVDDLTQQIITGHGLEFVDLAAQMRGKVDKMIASTKADQAEARSFEKKAEKLRKRFRSKKGPDYVGRMLDDKVAKCRQAIAHADEEIATFERARKMLDDVDFHVEARPQPDPYRPQSCMRASPFFNWSLGV